MAGAPENICLLDPKVRGCNRYGKCILKKLDLQEILYLKKNLLKSRDLSSKLTPFTNGKGLSGTKAPVSKHMRYRISQDSPQRCFTLVESPILPRPYRRVLLKERLALISVPAAWLSPDVPRSNSPFTRLRKPSVSIGKWEGCGACLCQFNVSGLWLK